MKLTDFVVGKKYKKIGGSSHIGEVGECVDISKGTVGIELSSRLPLYYIHTNPEAWEAADWIPKRGEKVLVSHGNNWFERIFLTKVEGSKKPYICVIEEDEMDYSLSNTFLHHEWRMIKQIKDDEITLTVNGRDVVLSEETIKAIQEAL